MKKASKLISIMLAALMLLSMAPISAFAASVVASGKFGASGNNLTWSLDSDGVLTVSGSGAMEDFANGASMPWYSKRANIKTVVIESGVTNIGKNAFTGFTAIASATISDTVTSIGDKAFSNSSLANFEFSDAGNLKTIGTSAFNSTNIKSMVISDGVTTLGSYIFGYGPIKSVTIPASVTSVGNYVFEETSSLSEVIFLGNKEPETIGNTVFLGCSSLAYVSVPADYDGDTFSNMKVAKAAASVAEVNGQGFATLADAISAAQSINGAELKLLSHISIDSGITIESGNFTIDLNGKELFSNGYFLLRIDGADVTIVDSADGGVFNATNDQGNIVLEVLSGSANVSGGTFNSAGYPAIVREGTLKLTGKDFVLNGNWRIGWYGGNVDLSACTADEVRIQACADGLQASAVTLPDGWGLFKTDGTPCTDFVKNDIYVAKAGFKLTASVNPAEGGTVEGAGTYSSGATVTLTASAASGYRFVSWIENGEEVSTSTVYTFTASKNRELTANFEIVPHTHSFTYTAGLNGSIVATCVADGCPLENGIGGTFTISAPADLYVDGTAKEITVENNLVDTSVAVDITYSTADGNAPKTAGTYTASATIGGATASVEFTLLNYVAKVTDKDGNELSGSPYKTLADAITAASASEGSTITLLDDITLTETVTFYWGKFTLDLNGKTITTYAKKGIVASGSDIVLTIDDSGENGKIETLSSESFPYAVGIEYATVNLKDGVIAQTGDASLPSAIRLNHGTLNVYGGKIFSEDSYAIETDDSSTVNVYDGIIDGYRFAVYNSGSLNIYGGTFYPGVFGNIVYNLNGTVLLYGGEFPEGFSVSEEKDGSVSVDFLAEGYAFYDKDGNKITVADDATMIVGYVQVKEHFVASATDKDGNELESSPYKTLADAITAASASEDSTLTLLDDITLTETARISSGKFIIDLNGKTILNKTDNVLLVYSHANITIKDSRGGGTVETVGDYCYGISNLAELTVESGTIKGNGSGISNHGTLTVNGGNFESHTYGTITNKGTAKIYGGVFEGIDGGEGIQNGASGEIYIYGGEISGNTALLNSGTVYISGGEFTCNDYAALNILKGTVEVTGGSFTGTDFSDGCFSGTPYGEWTVDIGEVATLILKGGEFPNGFVADEMTANALLADGYHFRDANGNLIEVADDAKIINGYVKVSKGADLAEAVITLDETQFTYSGMEHKPTVIVTVGGKTLTEGTDYTVSYANNINAGTATVTVKGIGQEAGGIAGGGEDIGNSSNSGDITESVYTGEVTKEFTINKKPVTVTATAPDKVYDGTADIDYDAIVITFNGIVEGDTVGYTVVNAWYNGVAVGEDWFVPIIYNATGEDANNYAFPEDGECLAPDYLVEATADIIAKDISDGFIILGDALTYNGTEQTQTVEKVLTTNNLEATFDVSGNTATEVGVYLLTVTGTGNFTGEAKITYRVALDNACVSHIDLVYIENNGVYERKWKVKSTDRASVEYVLEQVSNAVTDLASQEQKDRWNEIKEGCEEILGIINSIELFIGQVEEDYGQFNIETIKSSDIPALDEIVSKVNEIKDRYGFNLTEEENQKLDNILDGIENLKAKIAETEDKLEELEEAANGVDPETVTSDDKAAVEDTLAEIEAVNPDNLTDEQKAELGEIKAGLEAALEKIASDKKTVDDIGAELEMFDEERVTIFWEDDILELQAKIDELLADDSMGEAEKTKLNAYRLQTEKLINIINTPVQYFSMRFFYLIDDTFIWLFYFVKSLFVF